MSRCIWYRRHLNNNWCIMKQLISKGVLVNQPTYYSDMCLEEPRKLRKCSVTAETRTEHFLNTSLERYRYSSAPSIITIKYI